MRDPLFIDQVRDIVGLYLNPPERALVLCVDEKNQIQALDRTAMLSPMRPGQVKYFTHYYARPSTTSLFATLDAKTGDIIGEPHRRHRSVESCTCLDTIEKNVSPELDVNLILDNYGTPKTELIHNWVAKRPRFNLHFTPDLGLRAEPNQTMLRNASRKAAPKRRSPLHQRVGKRHPGLHRPQRPASLAPDLA